MKFDRDKLFKLAKEPPFRIIVRSFYQLVPGSVENRALWGISPRPDYLMGVLQAAKNTRGTDVREIAVVEFGVAGGNGLLALEKEAAAVEEATGVSIKVYGFDNGSAGLPEFIGDYRDHPDGWAPGDYPMDEAKLRSKLSQRTTLIIGNVKDTVPQFVDDPRNPPIGFISIDVDLYSSTRDALKIISLPNKRMLRRVPIYFDDIDMIINHRRAGELLAIDEFNAENNNVFIDKWMGIKRDRPFPEHRYLEMMYIAHDLEAISRVRLKHESLSLPLNS